MVDAMRAAPHRITYWGGVTYFMGIGALRHLAEGLPGLDYPAVARRLRPDDAYDWWNVCGVLAPVADMVMRGRAAAARAFGRWAEEDPRFRPLGECVRLLVESAQVGGSLFDELHAKEGVVEDPVWREHAAALFRRILEHDERCADILASVAPPA